MPSCSPRFCMCVCKDTCMQTPQIKAKEELDPFGAFPSLNTTFTPSAWNWVKKEKKFTWKFHHRLDGKLQAWHGGTSKVKISALKISQGSFTEMFGCFSSCPPQTCFTECTSQDSTEAPLSYCILSISQYSVLNWSTFFNVKLSLRKSRETFQNNDVIHNAWGSLSLWPGNVTFIFRQKGGCFWKGQEKAQLADAEVGWTAPSCWATQLWGWGRKAEGSVPARRKAWFSPLNKARNGLWEWNWKDWATSY